VSILLGLGDGTFHPATNSSAGSAPFYLATNELNDDGHADLAVSNDLNNGTINVLLGNGNGTFQAPLTISTGTGRCFEIVITDFNDDGTLDLATAIPSGVLIVLGDGGGTFQTPLAYAAVNGLGALASGDLSGDGFVDLAVMDEKAVTILLNDGNWPPLPIGGANPAIPFLTYNRPTNGAIKANHFDRSESAERIPRSSDTETTGTANRPAASRLRPELRAPRASALTELNLQMS
jgi:hypothetical protein